MPTTFRSTHHPGETPRGIVYTRFLARPLAVCTLPLMIGATMSALLEQPVWGYLVWGLPAALGLAVVWARFSMARTNAELLLRPGELAIRSVQDVLQNRELDWEPIYNVRSTSWDVQISAGRTTYVFQPSNWPSYEVLKNAARDCFRPETASAQSQT